ncbi:MAG: tRNA (adenosine(37)-N6)-dimethylallyltransferase MiaA [Bacteroidaceae bacterium]|nr:tRNA (adenosine(37)-N6)-dimethylallyltransferase MiaA [Bacteroidaceae bacterium]
MKSLAVILGPTGVGKTQLCLTLAGLFGSPIISADSKQMYEGIELGTAAPTREERERVKHYFVGNLQLEDYYSAAMYEEQALELIGELFRSHDTLIVTGGSMMYIDALCYGIDMIPTVTEDIRSQVLQRYRNEGLESMTRELKLLDPVYWKQVDIRNPKRVLHALEICYMTGRPYSSFRTGKRAERPFNIIRIGLTRPREELYSRIDLRVDRMIEAGLVEDARRLYPKRHLNSLNTVGYKELFSWMAGETDPQGNPWTLETAISRIKQDTRIYSRKQMTWFRRDTATRWFNPDDTQAIIDYIKEMSNADKTV